jgi:hypothetical protein
MMTGLILQRDGEEKEIKHEEDHRKKSYMHRKQFIWRNVATMAHSGISSACQALRARIS